MQTGVVSRDLRPAQSGLLPGPCGGTGLWQLRRRLPQAQKLAWHLATCFPKARCPPNSGYMWGPVCSPSPLHPGTEGPMGRKGRGLPGHSRGLRRGQGQKQAGQWLSSVVAPLERYCGVNSLCRARPAASRGYHPCLCVGPFLQEPGWAGRRSYRGGGGIYPRALL